MPIMNRDDAVEVENRIQRIFATSAGERAAAIRALFVEALDFAPASGEIDLAGAPGNVELPPSAHRVAELDGVQVVYVALDTPVTDRVRKGEAFAAVKKLSDQLVGDLLLVFTNTSASQFHLVQPSYEGTRPTLRRMVVERDLPRRTAVQQVSNIYWNHQDSGSIRSALDKAFDVEAVTNKFFKEYKGVFALAMETVQGFGGDDEEQENKKIFVQTLFNRLMFVYFLSRKGWLAFKDDKDYLNALWRDYSSDSSQANFYRDRLEHLFFFGLNNPQSRDLNFKNSYMASVFGDVPFLNGGLFEKADLDNRSSITVPDEAIKPILSDLFDRFNFTVLESTPFDIEVAVDPEMLGKVFEELVTGRRDTGSYYTPRPVVSFMCREALKGYLEGCDTGLTSSSIATFVDERDTTGISPVSAHEVSAALNAVTVVDPACGSGAYLLGMMQELIDLQTALFNVDVKPKGLYELKLHIIERNLYGVDIDSFAVNIAMLRLWLSLAIDYEGDVPEPLPNLDFKVLCGDSLLGPDPSAGVEVQGTLGQDIEQFRRLGQLKAEYMRAALGPDKERLRKQIENLVGEIRQALDVAATEGVVDWRVEFAEVFGERRGFDVALANPPYIHLRWHSEKMRQLYRSAGFTTYEKMGDIYLLFYERGCQLLKPMVGLQAYITSNSWLRAGYGKRLRRFFSEGHTPLRLVELGKDVFQSATVDSSVLILRSGRDQNRTAYFSAIDVDRLSNGEFPPKDNLWGQVRTSGEGAWVILSSPEQGAMDKIQARGTPLKDWDVKTYIGTMTGFNKAFLIDTATKNKLVSEESNAVTIIKPVLRGRDIGRYRARWAGLWLIDTHNGYGTCPPIDVNDYPTIKAHLDEYYAQLEGRYDQGLTPYNLRSCAYHEEFSKEKLFWMDLTDRGRFAYSGSEMFCLNTGSMLIGHSIKYLCAVLNSSLITWLIRNTALNSGMGVPRWIRTTVEQIPVPNISSAKQRPFVRLVDRILKAKDADPKANTEHLEREIDRLVYDLYGLTEEEDTAIERALGLIHQTDEDEDEAIARAIEAAKAEDPDGFVSEEEVMAVEGRSG